MADRIAFPQYVVAFLDILGFAAMVQFDSTTTDGPVYLPRVDGVLKRIKELVGDSVTLTQFSDSIVLAMPYSVPNATHVIRVAAQLQYQFCLNGILLRGGISFGRHFSTSHVMYSSGLVSAYRLESQHARYPRILVDGNLLALIEGNGGAHVDEVRPHLVADEDNRVFVNYLGGKAEEEYSPALGTMVKQAPQDIGVIEKFSWLARYHAFLQGNGHHLAEFGLKGMRMWEPKV